jgi:hypothetical protein
MAKMRPRYLKGSTRESFWLYTVKLHSRAAVLVAAQAGAGNELACELVTHIYDHTHNGMGIT